MYTVKTEKTIGFSFIIIVIIIFPSYSLSV